MATDSCALSPEEIVAEILKSRKNSNLIVDLGDRLLSEDETVVFSCIEPVKELFLHFLGKKEMCCDVSGNDYDSLSSEDKYRVWLREQFDDFKSQLLNLMQHSNQGIQKAALDALMKILEAEGSNPIEKVQAGSLYFPKQLLAAIVCVLTSSDTSMLPLIVHFEEYLKYDDVKLYVLKSVLGVMNNNTSKGTAVFVQNVFALLSKVHFPKSFPAQHSDDSSETLVKNTGTETFALKKKAFSRVFSQVWVQFLRGKLSSAAVYKKVLVYLPKKVLPHLNDPLVMTDFLTDSYNVGGIISLLALNGIFYLMQNFNLEYPEFFKKLYAMFTEEILTSKFRARFFFLSDLFLSSTHLPAYLVAAFIKRLARLALCMPPDIILIILPFIGNLLIRHPSLKVLINNPDKQAVEDPYNFEEPDPTNCHALESSLWEIKSLQSHWNPDVSKKAKFINSDVKRPVEWNLSDLLDVTVMDMLEKELERDFQEIPTSYDKPTGLFERKEDTMNFMWTL